MKKLNVPVKSRGAVVFAFNTEINYVQIAEQAARLITHILKLPVTLITNQPTDSKAFDQVICIDHTIENRRPGRSQVWKNGNRYQAYELSPYDETLLLDADYLILDDSLLKLFEQEFDYRIMTHNQIPDSAWVERMGQQSLQYQWATVVLFRKTIKARMLFELVGKIQRNYLYYLNLYMIGRSNFRNDYAFTIANNILNGYDQGMNDGIPWPMLTFYDYVKSMTIKDSLITVKEKDKAYIIPKQNIHVMDKEYLLSDNFTDFVEQICAG